MPVKLSSDRLFTPSFLSTESSLTSKIEKINHFGCVDGDEGGFIIQHLNAVIDAHQLANDPVRFERFIALYYYILFEMIPDTQMQKAAHHCINEIDTFTLQPLITLKQERIALEDGLVDADCIVQLKSTDSLYKIFQRADSEHHIYITSQGEILVRPAKEPLQNGSRVSSEQSSERAIYLRKDLPEQRVGDEKVANQNFWDSYFFMREQAVLIYITNDGALIPLDISPQSHAALLSKVVQFEKTIKQVLPGLPLHSEMQADPLLIKEFKRIIQSNAGHEQQYAFPTILDAEALRPVQDILRGYFGVTKMLLGHSALLELPLSPSDVMGVMQDELFQSLFQQAEFIEFVRHSVSEVGHDRMSLLIEFYRQSANTTQAVWLNLLKTAHTDPSYRAYLSLIAQAMKQQQKLDTSHRMTSFFESLIMNTENHPVLLAVLDSDEFLSVLESIDFSHLYHMTSGIEIFRTHSKVAEKFFAMQVELGFNRESAEADRQSVEAMFNQGRDKLERELIQEFRAACANYITLNLLPADLEQAKFVRAVLFTKQERVLAMNLLWPVLKKPNVTLEQILAILQNDAFIKNVGHRKSKKPAAISSFNPKLSEIVERFRKKCLELPARQPLAVSESQMLAFLMSTINKPTDHIIFGTLFDSLAPDARATMAKCIVLCIGPRYFRGFMHNGRLVTFADLKEMVYPKNPLEISDEELLKQRTLLGIDQTMPANCVYPGADPRDMFEEDRELLYLLDETDLQVGDDYFIQQYPHLLRNQIEGKLERDLAAPMHFYMINSNIARLFPKSSAQYERTKEFQSILIQLLDSHQPTEDQPPLVFEGTANINGNHYITYWIYKNPQGEISVVCIDPSPALGLGAQDPKQQVADLLRDIFNTTFPGCHVTLADVTQQLKERDCGFNSLQNREDAYRLSTTDTPLLRVNANGHLSIDLDALSSSFKPAGRDIQTNRYYYDMNIEVQSLQNRQKWADRLRKITHVNSYFKMDELYHIESVYTPIVIQEDYSYADNVARFNLNEQQDQHFSIVLSCILSASEALWTEISDRFFKTLTISDSLIDQLVHHSFTYSKEIEINIPQDRFSHIVRSLVLAKLKGGVEGALLEYTKRQLERIRVSTSASSPQEETDRISAILLNDSAVRFALTLCLPHFQEKYVLKIREKVNQAVSYPCLMSAIDQAFNHIIEHTMADGRVGLMLSFEEMVQEIKQFLLHSASDLSAQVSDDVIQRCISEKVQPLYALPSIFMRFDRLSYVLNRYETHVLQAFMMHYAQGRREECQSFCVAILKDCVTSTIAGSQLEERLQLRRCDKMIDFVAYHSQQSCYQRLKQSIDIRVESEAERLFDSYFYSTRQAHEIGLFSKMSEEFEAVFNEASSDYSCLTTNDAALLHLGYLLYVNQQQMADLRWPSEGDSGSSVKVDFLLDNAVRVLGDHEPVFSDNDLLPILRRHIYTLIEREPLLPLDVLSAGDALTELMSRWNVHVAELLGQPSAAPMPAVDFSYHFIKRYLLRQVVLPASVVNEMIRSGTSDTAFQADYFTTLLKYAAEQHSVFHPFITTDMDRAQTVLSPAGQLLLNQLMHDRRFQWTRPKQLRELDFARRQLYQALYQDESIVSVLSDDLQDGMYLHDSIVHNAALATRVVAQEHGSTVGDEFKQILSMSIGLLAIKKSQRAEYLKQQLNLLRQIRINLSSHIQPMKAHAADTRIEKLEELLTSFSKDSILIEQSLDHLTSTRVREYDGGVEAIAEHQQPSVLRISEIDTKIKRYRSELYRVLRPLIGTGMKSPYAAWARPLACDLFGYPFPYDNPAILTDEQAAIVDRALDEYACPTSAARSMNAPARAEVSDCRINRFKLPNYEAKLRNKHLTKQILSDVIQCYHQTVRATSPGVFFAKSSTDPFIQSLISFVQQIDTDSDAPISLDAVEYLKYLFNQYQPKMNDPASRELRQIIRALFQTNMLVKVSVPTRKAAVTPSISEICKQYCPDDATIPFIHDELLKCAEEIFKNGRQYGLTREETCFAASIYDVSARINHVLSQITSDEYHRRRMIPFKDPKYKGYFVQYESSMNLLYFYSSSQYLKTGSTISMHLEEFGTLRLAQRMHREVGIAFIHAFRYLMSIKDSQPNWLTNFLKACGSANGACFEARSGMSRKDGGILQVWTSILSTQDRQVISYKELVTRLYASWQVWSQWLPAALRTEDEFVKLLSFTRYRDIEFKDERDHLVKRLDGSTAHLIYRDMLRELDESLDPLQP